MLKFKIKKGDKVLVTTGKDKGKQGEVLLVLPKENKVVIAGINILKKYTKPSKMHEGGIVPKECPIHISNVSHIDPKLGCATKIGIKILEDQKKVRFAKKSGEIIMTETL